MSFPIDFKQVHSPTFRKLNKAISKHKYEVTVYKPDGTFGIEKVDIQDTQGRMGKEQFYELRYHSSWRLIGEDDFLTFMAEWHEKNQKFIEAHQKSVVELDHENTNVTEII